MTTYEYRRLLVRRDRVWGENWTGGAPNLWRFIGEDTGSPDDPAFASEGSEWEWPPDGIPAHMAYLNRLGQDGWRVLYFSPETGLLSNGTGRLAENWPLGTHVLLRERG